MLPIVPRSPLKSARLVVKKVCTTMILLLQYLTYAGHIASECTGTRLLYDDSVPILESGEAWKEVKKSDGQIDILRGVSEIR